MKRPGGFDGVPEPPEQLKRTAQQPAAEPVEEPATELATVPLPDSASDSVPDLSPESADQPVGGGLSRLRSPRSLFQAREPRPVDPVKAAEKRVRAAERLNKKGQRRETRRFTATLRRTRRRSLIVVSAVLALVVFVLVGVFTPLMSVRQIQVEGAQTVNVDDVTVALQRFEGVPLALVDDNEVLHALSTFPLIQRFAIERIPPSTLLVRIEERVPAVAIETDGVVRLYDAAGVLVAEGVDRPEGVPLGGDGLRNTSSAAFRAASRVVRDMPAELRAQAATVDASTGQDVTFGLTNGIEVFWGNANDTQKKSLILQTMLASLEGRAVSHIDVSSTESPIFR